MTRDEFVYSDARLTPKYREMSKKRAAFYDWFQKHKDEELPPLKTIAKQFNVDLATISYWIRKIV